MAENISALNEDRYVLKEVFDARMDRMEMLLEKTALEIKTYVDNAVVELKTEINEVRAEVRDMRSDMKLLSSRIDSLENVFYWGLGGFSIILASAILVPAILGFLKKLFKPSVQIEDIERVVEAALSRRLSGGQQ